MRHNIVLHRAHEGLPRHLLQMAVDKYFIVVVVQTGRRRSFGAAAEFKSHALSWTPESVVCVFVLGNNQEFSLP